MQCVNQNVPEECLLACLREAEHGGKAKALIADLLDNPGAYGIAWAELVSWFDGSDRHLEQQIRELMNYLSISSEGDVDGLQKYAIKLRSTTSNLWKFAGT